VIDQHARVKGNRNDLQLARLDLGDIKPTLIYSAVIRSRHGILGQLLQLPGSGAPQQWLMPIMAFKGYGFMAHLARKRLFASLALCREGLHQIL